MTQLPSVDRPSPSPTGSLRWALGPVQLVRRLMAEGRTGEAVERLRQRPYEELRASPELAVLFAEALIEAGDLEHADRASVQAASAARTVGDGRVEAQAMALSGQVALALGDLVTASRRFSHARSLAWEQHDTVLAGECLARLGEIALASDDPASAVSSFLSAIAAFETVGADVQAVRSQLELANAYRQMSRIDHALDVADRAVAAAGAHGDTALRADALMMRAEIRLAANDPGVALREAVEVAALRRSIGDVAREAEALSLARRAQGALGAPRRRRVGSATERSPDCRRETAHASRAEFTEKSHVR